VTDDGQGFDPRSVTPLAYLMYCWPIVNSTPFGFRRLAHTMRELRRYHPDQLEEENFQALCDIADLLDELI
jgi:hypothetical protein